MISGYPFLIRSLDSFRSRLVADIHHRLNSYFASRCDYENFAHLCSPGRTSPR